ncbi:MAG: hypothetical protein U1E15_07555 [Hyphomicrobiales bacterium]
MFKGTNWRNAAILAATMMAGIGSASADNATFINPKIHGHSLDWCKVWGDKCGSPAAQAFCWYQDQGKVLSFTPNENPQLPTEVISSKELCKDDGCTGFKKIVCAPKAGEGNLANDEGMNPQGEEPQDNNNDVAQQGSDGEEGQPKYSGKDANGRSLLKEQNLGGQINGDISATAMISKDKNRIAIFGRGTDGALWWRPGTGAGPWDGDWSRIGGEIKYSPSCTTFNKYLWCFVVGMDDALWYTSRAPGGDWTEFQSLGGVVTGSPSAVAALDAKGNNALYAIVRTTQGQLSVKAWYMDPETELYGWADYRGLGWTAASAPSCAWMGGTHVDCYVKNNGGSISELTNVLVGGGQNVKLGGETEKRPNVMVSGNKKQVTVVVKGMDGFIWSRTWKAASGFADWKQSAIPVDGQPTCRFVVESQQYWCFDVKADKSVRAFRFGEYPF